LGKNQSIQETTMSDAPPSLVEALHLVGWGPRQLVAVINRQLSLQGRDRDRLDPTAAYAWVRQGYCPRTPIPEVAARVLSAQLGFTVTVAQLWPGRSGVSLHRSREATLELDAITSVDDLVGQLNGLSATGVAPQTEFVGSSGHDLNMVVLNQLREALFTPHEHAGRERVLPEQVNLIESHVAALRRLDDKHGGGALNLSYVTAELRSVIDLFRYANHEPKVGRQLLTSIADLAQLLGWLQFDSGRYGPAERYLLLSIGVCRSLNESGRAANAIGMLSYVSAFASHGRQALLMAEAASREGPSHDPILRARLLGREATAAAADGDLERFRRSSEQAMELLVNSPSEETASYLYYLVPEQLAAETGQGLVTLAERSTANRKHLLSEAVDLLQSVTRTQAPEGVDIQTSYSRSALLYTSFLAKAHL
jgi:hypothetical protein